MVSLDAFRGASMALMVLVNTPGDYGHVYAPLEYSQWNGWTPTDVVFPSFMWIIGVAMTIVLTRRLAAGVSRSRIFSQACRRAVTLYVLGLVVYAYPNFDLSTQRLFGVLQRFIRTAPSRLSTVGPCALTLPTPQPATLSTCPRQDC